MKVFISWSGEHSNKIAEVLKKWLKHVIQSVEPFVSSEDISKGARWSSNIAKELQNTNFGILCVTKDNFQQPWLLFEAGALSKTIDTSYVVPLLFNLEPSDLSDSPLLQFQAATFSKDEIKKLIDAINNASENKLDAHELEEAFNVWYPQLENSLKNIAFDEANKFIDETVQKITDDKVSEKSSQVLEEILALSRENQKLLRNPESFHSDELKAFSDKLERLYNLTERNDENRRRRRLSPMMFDEMLHFGRKEFGADYGMLILLSFFKEDYPWLYDLGKDLFDILKSNKSQKQKDESVRNFKEMLEHSSHFIRRFDKRYGSKEDMMIFHELPMMLMELIDRLSPEELS